MARWIKLKGRSRRHRIIRKTLFGTGKKPRVSVYRSLKNLYAQIIDDSKGHTIISLSTLSPDLRDKIKKDSGNTKGADILGETFASLCQKKGIRSIVFDRSGYLYHGRIKAFAEALRKGGLDF